MGEGSSLQSDRLVAWLSKAYLMEGAVLPVIEGHARGAVDFPEVRERLDQGCAEAFAHREQVARCLRLLGDEPPRAKSIAAGASGVVRGVVSLFPRAALLDDLSADYA